MKRSSRPVKPNSKYFSETKALPEGPKRRCDRSGCTAYVPICFARVSERCAGSNWTSRWYHLTLGEHYCNECFEHYYRSYKDGYKEYDKWKRDWSSKARTEPGVAPFMVEKILPYWVQCRAEGCGKWRQLSRDLNLTPEFIDTFVCGRTTIQGPIKKEKQDACSFPEDERIHYIHSPLWLVQNKCTPFLKNSPAAPFLSNYYPDGVGLSPTEDTMELSKEEKKKLCPYVIPFPKGDRPLHVFSVMPDMMMDVEIESFPLVAQECPYMYLTIRNLIMAMWAVNPKEWLTKEKCMKHIICRGLARVSCAEILPQILSFLTYHNFINQGLLTPPAYLLPNTQESVIIIGAGASGLGAAHLLHSHGIKVTVVEAKDRLGGRVCDEKVNGMTVSSGGQLLSGCVNNPIAVIAYQLGIDLEEQSDTCQLMNQLGELIDGNLDRRIEFHYNAILDIVSEWRKNSSPQSDVPLLYKFKEFHEEFVTETEGYFSKGMFSQEEEQVMNFHLSSLECACGCSLGQLSSLQWDQNEEMPQFGGSHMVLPEGYGVILSRLAEGLDVRYNCQVADVKYTETGVVVNTSCGPLAADKVIVTLPLSVLKAGSVAFHPPLPESMLRAQQCLGAGHVEKVILQFEENFWSDKVKSHKLFGLVPSSESQRGLFNLFYPASCVKTGKHMLSTYLAGKGLSLMEGKSNDEIVRCCMEALRTCFPEKDIPQPIWSYVTHWSQDPHIGMACSHIAVGAEGAHYDHMAESVEERVYFAGEATNRQFPQTVTGAYLSGVREARKIIDSLS